MPKRTDIRSILIPGAGPIVVAQERPGAPLLTTLSAATAAVAAIFEVILPMTASARDIDRVYRYYADQIIGRQHIRFRDDDITIAEWIGDFYPARIQVIPLFEDVPNMLRADSILEEYLADKEVTDQRVFLARSDTAMNYGLVAAALANKIALARLAETSARIGVRLHPILGTGSAPFRGGLSPLTAERVGMEYPSVVTFSIQSAFKYDYPPDQVRAACEHLKARRIGLPAPIDAERAMSIIKRTSAIYRRQVVALAPQINRVSRYMPPRRTRKLHIGLFGYAAGWRACRCRGPSPSPARSTRWDCRRS